MVEAGNTQLGRCGVGFCSQHSFRHILFANFHIQGADSGPAITEDSGNNGSYSGTGLVGVSNIAFVNFTGYLNDTSITASVRCSKVHPCYNTEFEDVDLTVSVSSTSTRVGKCAYIEASGVHGITGSGC